MPYGLATMHALQTDDRPTDGHIVPKAITL